MKLKVVKSVREASSEEIKSCTISVSRLKKPTAWLDSYPIQVLLY
jgi:hypothetical protein